MCKCTDQGGYIIFRRYKTINGRKIYPKKSKCFPICVKGKGR